MTPAQARVAEALRAGGGLLAAAVEPATDDPPGSADPREVAVAAIREGYALHASGARRGAIVATDDPDLCLLAGDRLYALGLAELARASDLAAVRVLAGVIADAAAARGAGDEGAAEAAWEQGFRQLAHAPRPSEPADR